MVILRKQYIYIYIVHPKNFVFGDSKNVVCKLKKSIYSLKQVFRRWYHKFHQVITLFGFKENVIDECTYHKFIGSKFIFLVLYVDDILLASSDIVILHETKRFLSNNFEMKDLGDAYFVLRIHIYRDRNWGILRLSQKKKKKNYIDKVLNRFSMKDYAPRDTHVTKGDKFSLSQCPNNELEQKEMQKFPYASAVGVSCMLKCVRV